MPIVTNKLSVIDLFSGIGMFSYGLHKTNLFETIAFCEVNESCRKVLEKNFEGTPIFEDVCSLKSSDLGLVDVICGGFPCFKGGTLINTEYGLVNIEDIKVGTKVLTHTNTYKPVVQTMNREGAEIYNVKIMGTPMIETTSEHPFYTLSEDGPKWKKVNELTVGDLIAFPVSEEVVTEKDFDPYLLGRWLGDGWVVRYKRKGRKNSFASRVYWCCSKEEEPALEGHFKRIGYNVTKDAGNTVTKYVRQDKKLANLLEDFGNKAYGKRIPNWVYSKPPWWRESFLMGYLDSDGNKRAGGFCYTTVSKYLAIGVSRLIRETYGRVASIHEYKNDRECVIDGHIVNERKVYQVVDNKSKKTQCKFKYGRWWAPVRSIKNTGDISLVYNIGVLDDESYVANGVVVHNCQDISVAGTGLGLSGERSGLWREYARLIGEIKPKGVMIENVSALLRRGLSVVLSDLNALGYDAEWHCITAKSFGAPHERDRIFILAYRNDLGIEGFKPLERLGEVGQGGSCSQEDLQQIYNDPFGRSYSWPQPLLRRMDVSRPDWVDQIKQLGNTVYWPIVERLGYHMYENLSLSCNTSVEP